MQDAIRLRRNLTLQVGLRDEFTNGWNEVFGRGSNYIPDSTGVLETTPRVASDIFTVNNAKHLWQPRVALAWDPFGDGKTAIRAGFGLSLIHIFTGDSLEPVPRCTAHDRDRVFTQPSRPGGRLDYRKGGGRERRPDFRGFRHH